MKQINISNTNQALTPRSPLVNSLKANQSLQVNSKFQKSTQSITPKPKPIIDFYEESEKFVELPDLDLGESKKRTSSYDLSAFSLKSLNEQQQINIALQLSLEESKTPSSKSQKTVLGESLNKTPKYLDGTLDLDQDFDEKNSENQSNDFF